MKRFELLDHTADTGIIAYGRDLKDVFCNAAYGMFSIIADLRLVKGTKEIDIAVSGLDLYGLLVAWLSELLYYQSVKNILFSQFNIDEMDEKRLKGRAYGEVCDKTRHELKTEIKTVTYHQLKIEEIRGIWRIQVIFDI
ncbi:MAG: archease [bacterium]|nr:archease [bacterium]